MIDFEGDVNKIQKDLAKLDAALRVKAVRRGLVKAAAPIKRQMKENAPDRRGILKKAIGHKTLSGKNRDVAHTFTSAGGRSSHQLDDDQQAVLIGPNRKVRGINPSFYSTIVEFGAKPHRIKPRKKSGKTLRLSFSSGLMSKFGFAKSVLHPGVKANPFMANSLAANESKLSGLFYQGISSYLDKL